MCGPVTAGACHLIQDGREECHPAAVLPILCRPGQGESPCVNMEPQPVSTTAVRPVAVGLVVY